MRTFFLLIGLSFFAMPSMAQEDTDQATIRCYYRFSHTMKTGDKETIRQDTLTLDIGHQMSRYYDERKLKEDSVFLSVIPDYGVDRIKSITVFKDREPDGLDRSSGDTYLNNTYNGITEQIYKNRKEGTIILLNTDGALSSDRYKGIDPVGTFNWTIESDTAVFLDYLCQKANLRFRGRNYEAWFTLQIPINEGPWKFFGLPGLILKVNDADGLFDFECIGLEYLNTSYDIKIPEYKYFECNWKNYNKVMIKKSDRQMININNGNITIASFNAGSSFHPMELE